LTWPLLRRSSRKVQLLGGEPERGRERYRLVQPTGEQSVPDNKSKRGGPDRKRVAGDEPYELNYFARKHGLTADEARKVIERAGPTREKANRAAEKLSR
jgi:hypothetical protein